MIPEKLKNKKNIIKIVSVIVAVVIVINIVISIVVTESGMVTLVKLLQL